MTKALRMIHTVDPRQEIYARVRDHIDNVEVMGAEVLLGIYIRPDKTAGGIFLSDRTRNEDKWQGKVALVLKKGPIAFVNDERHNFGDKVPDVGDWVALRVGDSFQLSMGEQMCRIAEDVNIKLILKDPDSVY